MDGTLKSFTAPAPSAASSSRGAMDPVASAVMYPFTHDWNSHTTVSDISSTGTAEISATAATTSSTVNRNGNGNDILALGGGNRILNRLGIRISVLLITVWVL